MTALVAATHESAAQQRADPIAEALSSVVWQTGEVPAPDVAFLGALGGALSCIPGLFLGGAAYYAFDDPAQGGDLDGLAYAVMGCWAAGSIGLAGSTHLANRRRGNFWWDLAASLGTGVVGAGLILALDAPESATVLVPISQVLMTVLIEKWAERR